MVIPPRDKITEINGIVFMTDNLHIANVCFIYLLNNFEVDGLLNVERGLLFHQFRDSYSTTFIELNWFINPKLKKSELKSILLIHSKRKYKSLPSSFVQNLTPIKYYDLDKSGTHRAIARVATGQERNVSEANRAGEVQQELF